MGNYIKTLILSTIVLVIGNNSNYCYSMEEEEINTSSNQNNNNTNNINEQQNINQNNNKDYEHLFDIDYNKNNYEKICNECINNVIKNKKEYEVFIETVSQIFDSVINTIISAPSDRYNTFGNMSIIFLKEQKIIQFNKLQNFSQVFDSILSINNIKSDELLNSNNSSIIENVINNDKKNRNEIIFNSKLTQEQKNKQLNELLTTELSPIDVFIYIQNSIRKLKAQVIKNLEYSILNSYDDNTINNTNEKITKKAQQILERICELYYNTVHYWFLPNHAVDSFPSLKKKYKQKFKNQRWQLKYETIKYSCNKFEKAIAKFDRVHYNGSKLQTRFNNLHKKVMAVLNKMIQDIKTGKLKNREVIISSEICMLYSKIIKNTDSDHIKKLFDEFNDTYFCFTKWQLNEFLERFKEKLEIVKKLIDRNIEQQIEEYHTLLNLETEIHDNLSMYHMFEIDKYLRITERVTRVLHNDNHIQYKLLVQCSDFLDEFNTYYGDPYLLSMYRVEYLLKYNPGQSPRDIFKAVLDNNNDSFNLDGNNVENLPLIVYHPSYAVDESDESDYSGEE